MSRSEPRRAGESRLCPHCGGRGRVALQPELQATLDVIRKRDDDGTAAGNVARALAINPTAACNRLVALLKLDPPLVYRVRDGKRWIYYVLPF